MNTAIVPKKRKRPQVRLDPPKAKPDAADPVPVRCWACECGVLVASDHLREILTPAECRALAAELIAAADVAALCEPADKNSGGKR